MQEEEFPTPLRSRGTSQTLIFLHGRRRILPNVSQSVPIGNWAFCAHFPIFSKIFFGSRKKIKIFGVRKKIGYVFRFKFSWSFEWCYFQTDPGTPSCSLGALKKITDFRTTLGIICYHSKKSLLCTYLSICMTLYHRNTVYNSDEHTNYSNSRQNKQSHYNK